MLAQPQFNVLSGGLTECPDEPRHVGVITAGSLTTTLLPIPQGVNGVMRAAMLSARLTVVIGTNEWRNGSCRVQFARTVTSIMMCDGIAWSSTAAYVQRCLRGALPYVMDTPSP